MATDVESAPVDRIHHFPPFPAVPAGVYIVPFAEFQEYGTKIFGVDGIERDGLGIPTIILPNRTKGPGGGKKKKKKGGKLAAAGPGTGALGEWWERWDKYGDHPRYRNQYESFISPPNQLYLACDDFDKHYDITPLQSSPHKYLKDLFDALQRFVGSTDGKSNQKLGRGMDVDVEEPISDDEDMGLEDGAVGVPNDDPTPPVAESEAIPPEDDELDTTPGFPKAQRFLDDPERAVKIFLSSFMHEKGLVWEHRKLTAAPRLIRFFLRFLARTGVIPKSDESNALKVVEKAALDLPATLTISAALPEAFAQACEHAWGRAYSLTVNLDLEPERPTKRARTEGDGVEATSDPGSDAIQLPDGVQLVTEAITADVDVDGGGWGGSNGWGDGEPTTADAAGWGDAEPTTSDAAWPPADSNAPTFVPLEPPKTLESLLGSTRAAVVERSMRGGLVEQSMRRIVSVNVEPDGTLAHVVLAPWLDWKPQVDDDQNTAPRIVSPSPSDLPHDMRKDDITLLVAPAAADAVKDHVGMGIWGTWVRLELVDGVDNVEEEEVVGKWYLQDVSMVIPSYWLV
ncbi:hypothetical protein C8F01DRAFT_1260417 [Mycena amicta]|nr:hypothetical protein C8F01DRAFT_1260417 [Mycena amicta]